MIEQLKVNWVQTFIIGIRVMWFLLGVYDIHQHPERFAEHPNLMFFTGLISLAVLWYTTAFAIPLLAFLRKGSFNGLSLFLELSISGSLFLFLSQDWDTGTDFYNFPVFIIGYLSVSRIAFCTAPVSVLALPYLSGLIWGHPSDIIADQLLDLLIVFAIGFSFSKLLTTLQRIKEMMGMIQQQNQTLEINAKQIERLTLAEERNRLSRELHDTVGHTFIAVITGMDAVQYLMKVSPDEADKHLTELRDLTRQGLDEIRQQIHQMAPDQNDQPLARTLKQISSQFAEYTSVKVHFEVEGDETRLSENIRITLIRFLQEALTNAVRHGRASDIRVLLHYNETVIKLRVTDNGIGVESLVKGFGIKAMTERLANINGQLCFQSSPQVGTMIESTIQVHQIKNGGMV